VTPLGRKAFSFGFFPWFVFSFFPSSDPRLLILSIHTSVVFVEVVSQSLLIELPEFLNFLGCSQVFSEPVPSPVTVRALIA
jgi:hypothetical protein